MGHLVAVAGTIGLDNEAGRLAEQIRDAGELPVEIEDRRVDQQLADARAYLRLVASSCLPRACRSRGGQRQGASRAHYPSGFDVARHQAFDVGQSGS